MPPKIVHSSEGRAPPFFSLLPVLIDLVSKDYHYHNAWFRGPTDSI